MSKFRDPETVASEVADDAADAGPGVARDTLADARSQADHAHHLLNDMVVELDGICDDRGLFPGSVASALRKRQSQLRDAAEWMEEFCEALDAEYEAVLEAMDDA